MRRRPRCRTLNRGTALHLRDDPVMEDCAGAKYRVRVAVTEIRVDGPRDIHEDRELEPNGCLPRPGRETTLAARKQLDPAGEAIGDADEARVAAQGKLEISQYQELFRCR